MSSRKTHSEAPTRHLLVPFNGTPAAERALNYACQAFPSADIVVLYVMSREDEEVSRGWVESRDQFEAWVDERRDQARDEVFAEAHRIADRHDRTVSTELAVGDHVRGVVDYWNRHDFDFLVMSVRGRGLRQILRYLTGDLGGRLVRTSTIPAVLVRDDMDLPTERQSEAERRILVPFDNSERSRKALEFTCSLFPEADITVLCMYVVWGSDQTVLLDQFDARNERMNEIYATVDRIAAEQGTTLDKVFGHGALDRAVLQYLERNPTDLVVTGTYGKVTISELTMPSAARRLVKNCPVPLAVVPAPVQP